MPPVHIPKAIPDGMSGAIPMLAIRGAAQALDFYKAAFGATEVMRLSEPSGKIGHAEIKIGDALIMLADEYPGFNTSPQTLNGTSVIIHLYVADVDAVAARAVQPGAKIIIPVQNQFYGDRTCRLADPFGHVWIFSTHIEDVSVQEMQARFDAMMKSGSGA
ncbi:MAG TPA: VOC family protein [Planctomycetota bacterium]|nr:VOC family protein [Planctomycetota bacterium]